jgi:thiol peroxidase
MRRVMMTMMGLAAAAMSGCACAGQCSIDNSKESEVRTGEVTLRGAPLTLEGQSPDVGARAPEFAAVATDMSEQRLSAYKGRTVVLLTMPSLDTPVCDVEARTFNERAAALPSDVVVLTVTMDLPFAMKRWCGAHGVERVVALSDSKLREVARGYGVLIRENGLLARAVWVIGPDGVIRYRQIVPDVASEPDYDAALAAAAAAAG